MDLNLKNKNVLITGASKGIGLACAKEFAAEGCNLHLVSRTEEDLLTAKKQIQTKNTVDISVYPLDLSRSSDVDTLAKKCSNIDILSIMPVPFQQAILKQLMNTLGARLGTLKFLDILI